MLIVKFAFQLNIYNFNMETPNSGCKRLINFPLEGGGGGMSQQYE
jgi:hypothetical protein